MNDIKLIPIGYISSPFKEAQNIPIQGCFGDSAKAYCHLDKTYTDGLKDLEGFSHAILIYHFHKTTETKITAQPYLENKEHGIFAIRSPYRPNKIGFSIVKIDQIIENKLYFTEVDMLDGTPLLDIKPFVKQFDNRENTKSGWIEKHFEHNKIPESTILK